MAGWALGQAGLKTQTRKGLAALILGANMPDIDVFFGNAPWDPLAIHRGFTHGLFGGVLLMPPILAGLLWLLDRWQVKRGVVFKSGLAMHFGWLLLGVSLIISVRRERAGREWRRLPQAAIVIAVLYIGANLLISQRAEAA